MGIIAVYFGGSALLFAMGKMETVASKGLVAGLESREVGGLDLASLAPAPP